MHALVIEDQWILADLVEAALGELGFDSVAIASDEEQAVSLALEKAPDLITADLRLGRGTGISAVRRICKDRPVPVIYLTAEASELQAVQGAIIVRKPFAPATLARAVTSALRAATASG